MTSNVVKDEFKNGAWWKNRTPLERTLILIIAFIVIIALALAVTVGILRAKDPSKEICLTPGCVKSSATILKYMNKTADPCEDFFEFACGTFASTTSIPEDKAEVSQFSLADEHLQGQLRVLVEEPPKEDELKPFKLAKDYYKLCMDVKKIEKIGLSTIKGMVQELGGWPVVLGGEWNERDFDWKKVTYQLRHMALSDSKIVSINIGLDDNNSTRRVLKVDQAGLNLSRKILLKGFNDTIVKAYYEYMVDVAVIFGAERLRAQRELKEIVEFEMRLSNISKEPEARRNASLLYNPMTIAQMQVAYPTIPWLKTFNIMLAPVLTVDEDEVVIVQNPQYLEKLDGVLKKTPKRVQANYLLWNAVRDVIGYLNEELRARQLKYSQALSGRTARAPRWKECVDVVSSDLQIALGTMYVRRFFRGDAKDKVVEMVQDIRDEFEETLKTLEWIDPLTKRSAIRKAQAIKTHVGHPAELLDDTKITEYYKNLEIDDADFLKTTLNITMFFIQEYIKKFKEPVNKTDWREHSFPAVVNAFYDTMENSIEFPAGILQGVFFAKDRPQYANYAAIGSIIGHEITHGFDDEGRQYDADGNLIDWWEPVTHEAFKRKAQCIIDQYGNFTDLEVNMTLNGINTQGENIADNGGIKHAYLAYKRWMKRNGPEQKLPGLNYTQKQLFWISAANSWCDKTRRESLKLHILNGYHSPAKYRVLGPFRNIKYFAKDFNCPLGTPMNPVDKCEVW